MSINGQITQPSTRTTAERNKLAHGIDDFASFTWAGIDMWNSFGAFIINDKKGSLKFYNGPSYTNNYTKQQFMDGYTNISGISFDTQKISFTVGVYWISIEDYRLLLNTLHPYEVNELMFSFNTEYHYLCKLEAIKDSIRHVVGKEQNADSSTSSNNLNYSRIPSSNQSGYRYYTELTLTFDVVGPACALSQDYYGSSSTWSSSSQIKTCTLSLMSDTNTNILSSDLDFPLTVNIANLIFSESSSQCAIKIEIQGKWKYFLDSTEYYKTETTLLTNISLKNVPLNSSLNFTYNSEHGLVSMEVGDRKQIVTLLTTLTSGRRIIKDLNINKFFLPGRFSFPNLLENMEELKLIVTVTGELTGEQTVSYAYKKRTNII